MREEAPVHWHPRLEAWLVTRYAEAVAALKDRRLGSGTVHKLFESLAPGPREHFEPMHRSLGLWLLYQDAPDHGHTRALLGKVFTPRMVARLRPLLEETVGALLDAVEPRGEMDLMGELAVPLPVMAIAGLLGAPREEHARLKRWTDALSEAIGRHRASVEHLEEAHRAWAEMMGFFRELVVERRQRPQDDLVSAMVTAEVQGRQLTEEEVLASCGALLFGGSETTTHLMGNGVLALLAWPEQRARLEAEPGLLGSAIEEFLRYDSPTQAAGRVAVEDLELGGQHIRKGQGVIVLLGAANRDPARFPEPDVLDLGRRDNAHVAFSFGPHYCLGASLARLEAEVAFTQLLRRFPRLCCAESRLEWLANPTIRGVTRLPLKLR